MTENSDHSKIDIIDLDSGGSGFVYVRAADAGVAICISLIDNGDIEVVIDCESALQLSNALQRASKG